MSEPRVLVVDDEPSITDFIAMGLRHEGFEVRTAPDGRAALKAAILMACEWEGERFLWLP